MNEKLDKKVSPPFEGGVSRRRSDGVVDLMPLRYAIVCAPEIKEMNLLNMFLRILLRRELLINHPGRYQHLLYN
jgi:hypothetical protein